MRKFKFTFFICVLFSFGICEAQHSIAREWNELVLFGVRNDAAKPTVHARNLWHTSLAMYDIWAILDSVAEPFFIGKEMGGYFSPFEGIPEPEDKDAYMREAISFASYRLMWNRYNTSPGAGDIVIAMNTKMISEGYAINNTSLTYQDGDPAKLGNYVAQQIIEFGYQDKSWQQFNYANRSYEPVNDPLVMSESGGTMNDPNRWQQLALEFNKDQNCVITLSATVPFLSPEWGQVVPFALKDDDLTVYNRDAFDYYVYHDPGPPPYLSLDENNAMSDEFKWGFSLVPIWSSHLDPSDGVMWDISPATNGNLPALPQSIEEYHDFYDYFEGGDPSQGHSVNPKTGQPYEPNIVARADYARVLAEFWADGPDSETPPGHWFSILNYVNDHPEFERKYRGIGDQMDALEWDVKAYFTLGGAMHDCAITAWGIKGWYDYLRPVSAIRVMATRGQSSDPNLPNFDFGGMPLVPDYIELVPEGDPLAGANGENVNEIKIKAWRGPDFIDDEEVDIAGVGWILAKNWWPYQRPTFVTPPFAGYVSGHSTYSRAAADVLAALTGDEFFPGGLGEFVAEKNEFLVFEDGPSEDIVLQWATYRDASEQTSLSRIWGGIHPPADDIPGRRIGIEIAKDAIDLAEEHFYVDRDSDGYYNYEDCDDMNPNVNPGATEVCDGIDNDCFGGIDNDLPLFRYFIDDDGDGFGSANIFMDTCLLSAPTQFVDNNMDCNDSDPLINPAAIEICDAIDNNCSGAADEGLEKIRYYFDNDQDGFGDIGIMADTCISNPPLGFVANNFDCNDFDFQINPSIVETCDGIDNDCNGLTDDGLPVIRYYLDFDVDGFGDAEIFLDTCLSVPPLGFVVDATDCNDSDAGINPGENDIADNLIDEDCTGFDYYKQSKVFPNPFTNRIRVHLDYNDPFDARLYNASGQLVADQEKQLGDNFFDMELGDLAPGVYYLQIMDKNDQELYAQTIIKI